MISIVSHGQGSLIRDLLSDINQLNFSGFSDVKLVITLNLPEDESFINTSSFDVKVVRNVRIKGFGANHNQAFSLFQSDFFLILNPDLRIEKSFSIFDLINVESKGVIAPQVVNSSGSQEDSFRRFPSFFRIFKRVVLKDKNLDYVCEPFGSISVDWVAGMFMLFDSGVFLSVRGFDDSYFMYLEDADICRRIHLAGFSVVYSNVQVVTHDAQRQSFKSFRYLRWHIKSMARFLFKNILAYK